MPVYFTAGHSVMALKNQQDLSDFWGKITQSVHISLEISDCYILPKVQGLVKMVLTTQTKRFKTTLSDASHKYGGSS